jgi:hypothetical protein
MFTTFTKSCSINIIVSLEYFRMEIPPSTRWGTKLSICPSSFALAIRIASMSATILKRRGEMDHLAEDLSRFGNNDQCHRLP